MGGFHDQHGNYRPDLVADAQKIEIDRLSAGLATLRLYADEVVRDSNRDLANARLERDGVASLNSSLITKLAMKERELEGQTLLYQDAVNDNAAKDGIIANLNERSAQYERDVAEAKARIAELAEANDHLHDLSAEKHALAERAEAERDQERLMRKLYEDAAKCWRPRAERAEAEIAGAMDQLCYTAGECDLVTACEHWVANFHETEARAERAEAAALASFPAGREG